MKTTESICSSLVKCIFHSEGLKLLLFKKKTLRKSSTWTLEKMLLATQGQTKWSTVWPVINMCLTYYCSSKRNVCVTRILNSPFYTYTYTDINIVYPFTVTPPLDWGNGLLKPNYHHTNIASFQRSELNI